MCRVSSYSRMAEPLIDVQILIRNHSESVPSTGRMCCGQDSYPSVPAELSDPAHCTTMCSAKVLVQKENKKTEPLSRSGLVSRPCACSRDFPAENPAASLGLHIPDGMCCGQDSSPVVLVLLSTIKKHQSPKGLRCFL